MFKILFFSALILCVGFNSVFIIYSISFLISEYNALVFKVRCFSVMTLIPWLLVVVLLALSLAENLGIYFLIFVFCIYVVSFYLGVSVDHALRCENFFFPDWPDFLAAQFNW